MQVTATELRQNLFKLLDKVALEGERIEVQRGEVLLQILPATQINQLDRLPRHDVMTGEPDSLLGLDWSNEWRP